MVTLQQDIAKKFISALEEGKELDSDKVEEIRKLLSDDKKIKADDFVKIFSTPVRRVPRNSQARHQLRKGNLRDLRPEWNRQERCH
ncbi:hypothetical protein P9A16_17125 [Shinella sp. 838]|uniref:hypothetical protein n=1 Tax=Shinella sp. 838 TaxID=3038164 RepID=UPI002414F9B3|nr:hypothetical protein [Shinella sp. 838]MDG4672858.1 hypothetical protein [Shinella sp. 838]